MNDPHTISRRRVVTGAGLTALALALPEGLLAGCGTGGSGKNGLTFWIDITGSANQKYFSDHVVDTFEKAKPNTNLEITYYNGDQLRQVVPTALQARSGPDIVRGLSASQDLAWANSKLLKDLNPYAPASGWSSNVAPWSLKPFTIDSKIYALPMREDTMMLFYNKTLFEQKNWTPPKNRDEFESLAKEAQGHGIIPIGGTNATYGASSEWLVTVFWNHYAGPDAIHQALTGKIHWTDPVFVDAIELLQSYFKKGWVAGSTAKYYSVPQATIGQQFGQGKVAMYPNGEWFMPTLSQYFGKTANNSNEWDWAPLPSLSSSVPYPLFEIGVGGSFGINAASKNVKGAADFLRWYYGNRNQALQRMAAVPATYNIPIPISGSLPSGMDPREARLLTSVQNALKAGKFGYVTWTWWGPKSDTFIYQGVDKVLNGNMTPQAYCSQLDNIFQGELKAGTVPPTLDFVPQQI